MMQKVKWAPHLLCFIYNTDVFLYGKRAFGPPQGLQGPVETARSICCREVEESLESKGAKASEGKRRPQGGSTNCREGKKRLQGESRE